MNKARLKRTRIIRVRDVFVLVCILIVSCTLFLVIKFNQLVTPRLIAAADMKITTMTDIVINKSFDKSVLGNNIDDILNIDMNSKEEINGVNFNMDQAYEIARRITEKFQENYSYIENGQWDKVGYNDVDAIKTDKGYVIAFPIGIASKYVFLANLGPKIPVRIKFIGTTLNTIETKLSDYGINNVLIEIFITMKIERQIITPVEWKRDEVYYTMPISSKLIQGKVPAYLGGILTKSANLDVPIS